jgi:hypothetical protein
MALARNVDLPPMPSVEPVAARVQERARLSHAEALFLLAAVLVCRVVAVRTCPIYDDAFITYRYARNFAAGNGLVFNPSAPWEPILGTTTPAYALLMSAFARFSIDLPTASRAVNVICDVASAWLILWMLQFRRVAAAAAILCFAVLPQLVRISMGGMEAPLFAALALGACAALDRGRMRTAGALAAATCVVRPEGVLLVGLLALANLRDRRALARFLLPVVTIGAATMALLVANYGDIVPQSVHAKSQMHGGPVLSETLARWKTILAQSFAPHVAYLPLLPFVLIGLRTVLAERGAARRFSLFALAITASYLAARPHTWGWYFDVPLVAWCMWLGSGIERAQPWILARVGSAATRLARLAQPTALAGGAIAAAALVSWKLPTRVPQRVYAPMQIWARSTSMLHPSARILASDIGAIASAWSGTVLDSEGLTWPEALRFTHPNEMISGARPEYVMIVAERARLEHFLAAGGPRAMYEPIARFSVDGATDLEPDLDHISPTWVQDYLVYRRVDL